MYIHTLPAYGGLLACVVSAIAVVFLVDRADRLMKVEQSKDHDAVVETFKMKNSDSDKLEAFMLRTIDDVYGTHEKARRHAWELFLWMVSLSALFHLLSIWYPSRKKGGQQDD